MTAGLVPQPTVSPWSSPIRAYITLAGEVFPAVVDATSWAALGEYLAGAEFGVIADRVLCLSVVNRGEVL